MRNLLKSNHHVDELQRINKYDRILDVIFDPNSYQMDEK